MTDLKTEVSQAADSAKSAAQSAVTSAEQTATAFEQKQIGWVRRNWLPLAIGFALGFLARCIL